MTIIVAYDNALFGSAIFDLRFGKKPTSYKGSGVNDNVFSAREFNQYLTDIAVVIGCECLITIKVRLFHRL